VVAVEGEPVGAAWWRLFTAEDPGYGFVDEATPQVSIGVLPEARGRGVGERLLRALIAEALEHCQASLRDGRPCPYRALPGRSVCGIHLRG
jgi:GNAT superfamily N-acetyltransferase